jgi:hypothetical protein
MDAVREVVERLRPEISQLVAHLARTGQVEAEAFFREAQRRLAYVCEEEQLLELFMLLSMTAFQGFVMDPFGASLADRILAYAEQVSHTFSADDERLH